MPSVTSSDGVQLHYEEAGQGRPLVLIHGWTFSGRFFRGNVPALAEHAHVITPDLRGHGRSDKPGHGYRVARLAADLRDLLNGLDLRDATLLGWSLGAPVIWSYLELFGRDRVRDAVFVQQSPRQYYTPEWKFGHATCYDAETLAVTCTRLQADPVGFDGQNLATCTRRPMADDERRFLLDEMAACPPDARAAIMADHTVQDWRDLLPRLDLPALVLVARQDKVFPWQGPAWVGEHMEQAETVFFEDSGHMLFRDEPEKFNAALAKFLEKDGE
jgi:pimeloyl-ACP methyl ester carboxylesterase